MGTSLDIGHLAKHGFQAFDQALVLFQLLKKSLLHPGHPRITETSRKLTNFPVRHARLILQQMNDQIPSITFLFYQLFRIDAKMLRGQESFLLLVRQGARGEHDGDGKIIGPTEPAVGYAVEWGERLAKKENYGRSRFKKCFVARPAYDMMQPAGASIPA